MIPARISPTSAGRLAILFGLALLTICSPFVAPIRGDEVGDWGDPARLQLVGLNQLSAQTILKAINSDPEFAWESHPRASLDAYLASLSQRIGWGLQRAGFPDSRVDVNLDAAREKLVATITEGPRYRTGRVIVNRCPDELAERLALWFTERTPPEDSHVSLVEQPNGKTRRRWVSADGKDASLNAPLWKVGQHATFDEPIRRALEKHAARGLANEGWDDARATVSIVRDDAARTANLIIDIHSLGEPSRITKIHVQGGPRDTRDEVLDYLALAEGQALSPERRAQLEHRLRASARYRRHKIESRRRFGGDGVDVTITLVEYPSAPRLSAALSREEEALLLCRDWMLRHAERGDDLIVRQGDSDGETPSISEIVIGGERGMLLRGGKPNGRQLALAFGAGEWGAYVSQGGGALGVPQTMREQLRGSLQFALSDEPQPKQPFVFRFGFGVHSSEPTAPRANFALDLQFEPVAMLALAHESQPSVTWQEHEMTLTSPRHRLRVDARTGRVLELQLKFDSGAHWQVSFAPDELPRRLAELRRESGKNHFDAERPMTSLARFAAEPAVSDIAAVMLEACGVQDPSIWRRWQGAARAMRQLVANDSFAPFDQALLEFHRGLQTDDDDFKLPLPDGYAPPGGFMRLLGGWGLRLIDRQFVRDTWPYALSRAIVSVYGSDTRFVSQDVTRLNQSPKFGPLGNLAASYWFPHPQAAVGFARQGLGRLSLAGFQAERDDLLRNLARTGCDVALVRSLRGMSETETAALGADLADDPELLASLGRRLRAAADEQAAVRALPAACDEFWQQRLAPQVERLLRARADLDTAGRPRTTTR